MRRVGGSVEIREPSHFPGPEATVHLRSGFVGLTGVLEITKLIRFDLTGWVEVPSPRVNTRKAVTKYSPSKDKSKQRLRVNETEAESPGSSFRVHVERPDERRSRKNSVMGTGWPSAAVTWYSYCTNGLVSGITTDLPLTLRRVAYNSIGSIGVNRSFAVLMCRLRMGVESTGRVEGDVGACAPSLGDF